MAIIINQHRRPGFTVYRLKRKFAEEVKTASGALETFQRAQNSVVFNTFFRRDRHCCRRVQCIVTTRRV